MLLEKNRRHAILQSVDYVFNNLKLFLDFRRPCQLYEVLILASSMISDPDSPHFFYVIFHCFKGATFHGSCFSREAVFISETLFHGVVVFSFHGNHMPVSINANCIF